MAAFHALALLGCWSASRRAAGGRAAVLAGVFLVLAALTDWYNLVYLALLTALWAGWFAWGARADLRTAVKLVAVPGAMGAASLLVLAPMLVPMAAEARSADYMVPDQAQIVSLSADLLGLVLPQEMHPLWGQLTGRVAARFYQQHPSDGLVGDSPGPGCGRVVAWRSSCPSPSSGRGRVCRALPGACPTRSG